MYYRSWLFGLGAGAATSAVVLTKDEDKQELEDLEYEVDQANETRFRKTRMFQHFSSYASTKYKNEVYMTANDFFASSKDKHFNPFFVATF